MTVLCDITELSDIRCAKVGDLWRITTRADKVYQYASDEMALRRLRLLRALRMKVPGIAIVTLEQSAGLKRLAKAAPDRFNYE